MSPRNAHVKAWTYLRFAVTTDLTRFTREVFAAFDVINTRRQLIDNRIWDIAYENPSNFTRYCREYLGQDYFDELQDSDDDSVDADEMISSEAEGTMVEG